LATTEACELKISPVHIFCEGNAYASKGIHDHREFAGELIYAYDLCINGNPGEFVKTGWFRILPSGTWLRGKDGEENTFPATFVDEDETWSVP
jgi:hypothetical protein